MINDAIFPDKRFNTVGTAVRIGSGQQFYQMRPNQPGDPGDRNFHFMLQYLFAQEKEIVCPILPAAFFVMDSLTKITNILNAINP
jgi:hypothetical protein